MWKGVPLKTYWYVATLIVQCSVEGIVTGPWMCDEQIRVLRAADDDAAYEKAMQLGIAEEHTYPNAEGKSVSWTFVGVSDLEMLSTDTIKDGIEIKSRLFHSDDPSRLVQSKDELTT